MNDLFCLLLRTAFWCAVFQLAGTALVLYALVVVPSQTGSDVEVKSWNPITLGREYAHSVVKRYRPRLFKLGAILLLGGLVLQVLAMFQP